MKEKIEETIISLLEEYRERGLSEEKLMNYVVARLGTEKPVNLEDYQEARRNLEGRVKVEEVEFTWGGSSYKEERLFLK